jgi:predicted CXXCH cytochrome family protein
MKTKYIFLIITIVIIGIVFVFPHKMLSPGNLYEAHSDLQNNCLACHKPFSGTPNESCISCHKISEIDKKNNLIQFHQNIENQNCISCHSDHKGINPKMALKKFDHLFLSENNINKCVSCHAQPKNEFHNQISNSCVSCHSTNNWKTTLSFNHDLIKKETKNNCIACHQNPKDNFHSNSTNNCISCHKLDKWKPSTFNHNKYFILDKDHNTDCKTCHTSNDLKVYTCYGCHEHSLNSIRGEHQEEGIYNFTNCVKCHKSANENDIKMNKDGIINYIKNDIKNEGEKDED